MNRFQFSRILAILALAPAIMSTGCQQSIPPTVDDEWGVVVVPSGQPIQLGLALSKTDQNFGPLGIEQARGAQLATRQFETINGFAVSLVESDPECASNGGATSASEIINNKLMVGVVGLTCQTSCAAAAPILENAHYTAISPSCGTGLLNDPVSPEGTLLTTSYSSALEGTIAGEFAFTELGARKAAIIAYDGVESDNAVAAFKSRFEGLSGIVTSISSIVPGQLTFRTAIEEAAANHPDVVYAPLLPIDAVNFASQVKDSPISQSPLIGGRYYFNQWFVTRTGQSGEGVYAVGPTILTPANHSLSDVYISVYGEEPSSNEHAFAYDAMRILLDAIKKVAVVDSNNNLVIGRRALRDAVKETANYHGVTGEITCTSWGDCSVHDTLSVGQIRSGHWMVVFIP